MTTYRQPAGLAATDPSESLQQLARVAGLLVLALVVLGPFSILYVPSRIVVDSDAAATASNLADNETLFRLGMFSDIAILLIEVGVSAVLYVLFRAVSPALSLASAMARLAQAAVMGANLLNSAVLLLLVGGSGYLAAFDRAQLDALVALFFDLHEHGVSVGQTFFGLSLLLLGVLIRRADLVPRVFGSLMLLAAAGYLADSIGPFLVPESEAPLAVIVGVTSVVGELPFFLWLLVKGVAVRPDRPLP